MPDRVFELKNFKEYLPVEVDISDKDCLRYEPILAPTILQKKLNHRCRKRNFMNI